MKWLRANGQKWSAIILVLALFLPTILAHVALVYPPARNFNLDFLDNLRTPAPCGMPKGERRTRLLAGSIFNVTWHLAYPHRGGYKLELLNAEEKPWMDLTPVTGKNDFLRSDTTAQQQSIRLPGDLSCEGCTIRLKREALEWNGNYTFWSCSDVDIVQAENFKEDCLGHGDYIKGKCECHRLYYGKRCEFKDECFADPDCGEHGTCVDMKSTNFPKKQCYCQQGWFGDKCERESAIKSAIFPLDDYFTKELSKDFSLYWRIVQKSRELEIVLRGNGTSYLAIGWRPQTLTAACKGFPVIPAKGLASLKVQDNIADTNMGSAPIQQAKPESNMAERLKDGRSLSTVLHTAGNEESVTSLIPTTAPIIQETSSEPEPSKQPELLPTVPTSTIEKSVTTIQPLSLLTKESQQTKNESVDVITESEPIPISESESRLVTTVTLIKPDHEVVGEAAHGLEDVTYHMDGEGDGEVSYTHKAHATTMGPSRIVRAAPNKNEGLRTIRVESSISEVRDSSADKKTSPAPQSQNSLEPTTHNPMPEPPSTANVNDTDLEPKPEPEPESEPEPKADDKDGRAFKIDNVSSGLMKSQYTPKLDFHAMDCTDIIIGSAHGDLSRVRDMYTRDRSTPHDDTYWGTGYGNDLTAAAASEKDGITTVVFRRKFTATESTDYAIENTAMHVIWAKGQEFGSYVHSPPSGLEKGSYSVRNFYRPDELKYHGGKSQRGILSLNFLENVELEEHTEGSELPVAEAKTNLRGEWKIPSSCRAEGCEYRAVWEYLPKTDEILFTISSSHVDQWTGIAFSEDTEMPNTDAILGWVDNSGRTFVMDTWISGYEPPQLDENQDVTNYKGSKIDGRITLEFRRKRSTGDTKQDLAFSDTSCLYLMFPYNGGLYNAVSKKIRKHSSTPAISDTKICIDGRLAAIPKTTFDEPVPTTPSVVLSTSTPSTMNTVTSIAPKTTTPNPQSVYYVAIRLPNQPLDEAIERGIDFKMLIKERLEHYMTKALQNEIKGLDKVNVTNLDSEKNESHVIAKISIYVEHDNQSVKQTVNRITEILNLTISTGTFGQLLVDPAYLIVQSPQVEDDNTLMNINTANAHFDADLVIYIVIAVAIAFGLLLFIQIVCTIHHVKMSKKAHVSKERLISDPGIKEFRGNSNYGYDAYQTGEDQRSPAKAAKHLSGAMPSAIRTSNVPLESISLSKSTPKGLDYGDHDHLSQIHYSRRSESLPRPVSGPVRAGPYNNPSYATHDPTGRRSAGPGLQPDFYFMPSQRRYSGEVVRVYVDYNAPNYSAK